MSTKLVEQKDGTFTTQFRNYTLVFRKGMATFGSECCVILPPHWDWNCECTPCSMRKFVMDITDYTLVYVIKQA